jgi:hypothetical protein
MNYSEVQKQVLNIQQVEKVLTKYFFHLHEF